MNNKNIIANENNFIDIIKNLTIEQITSLLEYAIKLRSEELKNTN